MQMNRRGIICAGCWTVDRIKLVDKWPAEEELARILAVERQGGGSSHNVGIDLCKLDPTLPVATIGLLGQDIDGDFLFDQATTCEMDTSQLWRTAASATSYTDVISVTDTGKRTFFHYPGANDLLEPRHFSFTGRRERILHLGLLSVHALMDADHDEGHNGWSKVLEAARSAGLKTSIEMVSTDRHRNRLLATPCLPHLDYLIVNDQEIGAIADLPTLIDGKTDIDICLQAADRVLASGNMKLVAVHYPTGAVCITRSGERHVTRSLKVPKSRIKGTVGAGDAFAAGFLYAIHEQWSVEQALELAHVVAAASLRSLTTVGAVGSLAQCRQFADELRSA
ncbi:MAG: carbohydrate kinase family protein [Granulosicoccus sp.]|nr:carbohydrate kinase family protein [Granulosicoccus sp.]